MKRAGIALFLIILMGGTVLYSENYKIAVSQLAPASTEAYKGVIAAIIEVTGNTADIQVLPFARCMYLIETKSVDIVSMIIALPDKSKWASLKYDYSTVEVSKVVFVLYTNKSSSITASELKNGNSKGYKIETDAAHTGLFSFAIGASTSIDASMRKVDSGEIDGFIFAQSTGDASIKKFSLKNIKRQYFDTYSTVFPIPKGERGGKMDKMLSDGMAIIKANGKYDEIMANITAAATYSDWQP